MENVKFLEIKSRYNEQKQHCSLAGTFMICGIEGRFEVHTIGSCCTRVTGRVSLISPLDGKIFLFDGARRRELIAKRAEDQKARIRTEKRPRELKATKELDVEIAGVDLDPMTHVVVFPQSANTAIKEAVAGKAERLYAEAQPTLARILENHGLGQNATALGLFYARSKAFFATEVPTKEQTRRRNQNSLQKICASLGDKPISCISAKDVTYLSKQFSNTELRRTARFFDFCKDRGDFACANPILEYMPTQKHTRNYSAERARAARMHGISGEAECALLKLAKDHTFDDFRNFEKEALLEIVLRSVRGMGDAGVNYMFMMAGDPNRCKPDVHIHRCIKNALGTDVPNNECQILFRETVKKLKDSGYPDLTVRNLDSVIWNKYQKNRSIF